MSDEITAEEFDEVVENSILADLKSGKPIKEIAKDRSKEAAVALGRGALTKAAKAWAEHKKAKAIEAGDRPVKGKIKKTPSKKAQSLRIGDFTQHGSVSMIQKDMTKRGNLRISFIGDNGVKELSLKGGDSVVVLDRREIRG